MAAQYEAPAFYDAAEAQRPRLARQAEQRVRFLSQLADRLGLGRSLLDVGCASGIFLTAAQRAGWEAEGVERSARLAARARARGFRVVADRVESYGAHRKYALVTAWEVIEHAEAPPRLLRSLMTHVVPGGLIAISTPASDGLPARILGPKFPMLAPPEHLCVLSKRAVVLLAGQLGLEVVRVRSFSNVGRKELSSACRRYLLPSVTGPRLLRSTLDIALPAVVTALGLPRLMDRCGLGTELEVVFRCPV